MSTVIEVFGLFVKSAAGAVVSLVFSPVGLWIARITRLIDIPHRSAHKLHRSPTPLAGGIILALSLVILIPLFHLWQKPISTVLALAVVIFLFGLGDDARGLSAPQKFVGQFIATILLVASNLSVHFLRNIDIPNLSAGVISILDWVVTIFWFVGITNAFNLIDSTDGLAVGIAGIAFTTFMIMAYVAQQSLLAGFCAICLGICIGLFYLNKPPARLFLGDAGALSLGFLLAAVGMIYVPSKEVPQGSSWFIPILVLGFPIFDTTLVVISRIRRKAPIFKADRTHTFHRLVALGLDANKAMGTIHFASLTLGIVAFVALSLTPWKANLVFWAAIFIGLLVIVYLERVYWQARYQSTEKNKPTMVKVGNPMGLPLIASSPREKETSILTDLEQKSRISTRQGLD
jgi:UDP-GlcNAc:undecaprenyl-phosphate GlcNAc-1-phosphate transferase